jgi:branched-chain amino acid transport system ATP-binding protein
MLSVQNLNVWYGATEVLRSVSFDVPRGQITALMGGNGAGKSTTLNALSGLVRARSGSISVDGARIDNSAPHEIIRKGVSQVPQGRFCWPSMSVYDNVRLGAVTRNDRQAIRDDMDDIWSLFPALKERQRAPAGALSGGQQQMVAIARALMARPRYLLMDEPSHGLAPKVVAEIIELIRSINLRGATILLVEQNVGVAAACAQQVHVLRNGEIALTSEGQSLLHNPQLLESYFGR